MDTGRLQPAFLGGLFIGVLSALPLVGAGNCCCCLWVVMGGMLAVYLRQQNAAMPVTAAEGAYVGLLAGLTGGLIGTLLSIPIEMMMGPFQRRLLDWFLASNPDLPGETREIFDRFATSGALVMKLLLNLVTGAIFGMLGGLLGVALFKKNVPPPVPGQVDILPPE